VADDVDDLAGVLTTQDGRSLAYLEVGDPDGPLVIHNHGGPSSRFEARLLANSASKNRLRLICVDRPGMGQSSPQKARSYSGWADDLVATAEALGYQEFGVTGWSEGGPWALAAAAYIDSLRLLALRFKAGFRLMYATVGIAAKHFRGSFIKQLRKSVNDYDRQILLRPEIETAFSEACAECFAQGSDGLVRDAELLYRSWAFDVATIERRVHMWQGLDDRLVPDPITKAVADRMPGAAWHPVEGAGHFLAVGSGDEVFAVAAEELGAP
jgi:pimeloyl-ACP methyl ester carboxylesterase